MCRVGRVSAERADGLCLLLLNSVTRAMGSRPKFVNYDKANLIFYTPQSFVHAIPNMAMSYTPSGPFRV